MENVTQLFKYDMFEQDLKEHGVIPERFWDLDPRDQKLILKVYTEGQKSGGYAAERRKKGFFRWLSTLRCYPEIVDKKRAGNMPNVQDVWGYDAFSFYKNFED
jgi:hypothetical protein